MLRNKNLTNEFDFIVPLQIHKKKEKERGYNQSFIITKEIGNQLNIPVKYFILKKTVIESQTRKRFYARWGNQENKFTLTKKKYLNGKRIIIINDVITSGSTMYNCISLFKKLEVRITVLFVANT